ncbi:MAG: hypothetical protein M5U26_05000 [Planctomycetota bacterium]|nr:hypothetical protein [Planctomycetota bacterium]
MNARNSIAWAAFVLLAASLASAGEWKVHPAAEGAEADGYKPPIEKHFKLAEGVLTATCGLGEDFYKNMEKHNVFVGAGIIWATDAAWPADLEHFELVFDYKWFQDEPMKKYGDFPDMHLGFRLDETGRGYYVRWGMLGQILVRRMDSDATRGVGHGTLQGMKGKWARVKLRAAGPALKVKIWNAEKPEPETWSAEAWDDWRETEGAAFKKGAIAVGFRGRKLFDTCVYEFKDFKLTPLSAEAAKSEPSFDAASAPSYIGLAGNSDTTPIEAPEPAEALAKDEGLLKDANVKIEGFGSDGMTISSTDGKPAFVWLNANPKSSLVAARMKSAAGARPLFALKGKGKDGSERRAYMDPVWREGLAALLWENESHTVSAYRFAWKPDVWYDFVSQKAHWHKWQILNLDDAKDRAAFVGSVLPNVQELHAGFGVAGKGGVTIKGFTVK